MTLDNGVAEIQRIVPLIDVRDRNAHHEGRENDILHTFELGACTTMPGVPTPVTKPCDASETPRPPCGWPMSFALRMKPMWNSLTVVALRCFGIADGEHLRLADGQRVETGNARAALPARVRIVQPVVVNEIVARDLTKPGVRIDAAGSFVISHCFGISRCYE